MGFMKPKTPAPPKLPEPPKVEDSTELTEDRLRRQRASGTSSNIISSLGQAKTDTQTATSISKLLG